MMVYKLKVWGEDQNGRWERSMTVTGDKLASTVDSFNTLEGYEDYDCDHMHIDIKKTSVGKLIDVLCAIAEECEENPAFNDALSMLGIFNKSIDEVISDLQELL